MGRRDRARCSPGADHARSVDRATPGAAPQAPNSVEVCDGRFHKAGADAAPGGSPQCATPDPARGGAPMIFVGIDVGKASLDSAATDPAPALPRRVPNT